MTWSDDAWRDSYDSWKLASPYDNYDDEGEADEELAFVDMLAAHAEPADFNPDDLFDFWESERGT